MDRLVDQQVKPPGQVKPQNYSKLIWLWYEIYHILTLGDGVIKKRYMTINIKDLVCIIRYLYYSCHYLMFKIDLARRERKRERERERADGFVRGFVSTKMAIDGGFLKQE